ncbi:hypothetical protein [Burkholderia perseverans]|uniref:hypothetical protein n=1 Tax=Burkholderia perseverans TaxID=2615214 RepID=UPI001FEE27F9|nr:hypothetical protein [Burkholderia perseverans]
MPSTHAPRRSKTAPRAHRNPHHSLSLRVGDNLARFGAIVFGSLQMRPYDAPTPSVPEACDAHPDAVAAGHKDIVNEKKRDRS